MALNVESLVIAFREGLEAALVVGILVSYLVQIGRRDRVPLVALAVVSAVLLSAAIAIGMQFVGAELETPYEQLFEGTTMLLAVVILTWMIFWMRYQSRFIKRDLEAQLRNVLSNGVRYARVSLFALAFLSVFREGVETALFLSASAFTADGLSTLLGSLAGLLLAAAAGVAIYRLSVRINLRMFFDVTSILLVLFAAGLLAHVVHEYQEIGLLPMLTVSAWNTERFLSNDSPLGSVLSSLLGYNAQPSVLEVSSYVSYWMVILVAIRWWTARLSRRLLHAGV